VLAPVSVTENALPNTEVTTSWPPGDAWSNTRNLLLNGEQKVALGALMSGGRCASGMSALRK
jgi:hypothetical protein